jgi:hypothetical protein
MSVDQVPGAEPASDILPDQASGVLAEIIVESLRVTGTIHVPGAPRRLVDIINSIEGDFVLVHEGQLDDPYVEHSEARSFDIAQVPLDAILCALPRGGAPQLGSPFETVAKVPVPGTLLLPGLEVSGDFYLLPDGRRTHNAIIAMTRGFAPVTDATVVSTRGLHKVWREPIVVVNLLRGFLYVPSLAAQRGPETL